MIFFSSWLVAGFSVEPAEPQGGVGRFDLFVFWGDACT